MATIDGALFDEAEIQQVAGRHDAARDEIENQLTQLRGQLDNVGNQSPSEMTKMLVDQYEQDLTRLKDSVLADLQSMSQDMRSTAGEQTQQDSDNIKPITSTPIENFIG
ncbi:hypothetical protein OOZ19_14725 [Saccharopolyspora sp. NFXS83]|uniref:hypothetical protein n=1 Tax=Saccharopolyspora sp. NFXS83 TaxID=2993560 RepID=UPI00224AC5BD|nr:hypothetical protein [Saccharopolyspora sp. NFXS83]MCX2731497.1 hypothetical protein [Saccharopolyspora sp. NFXS83]